MITWNCFQQIGQVRHAGQFKFLALLKEPLFLLTTAYCFSYDAANLAGLQRHFWKLPRLPVSACRRWTAQELFWTPAPWRPVCSNWNRFQEPLNGMQLGMPQVHRVQGLGLFYSTHETPVCCHFSYLQVLIADYTG